MESTRASLVQTSQDPGAGPGQSTQPYFARDARNEGIIGGGKDEEGEKAADSEQRSRSLTTEEGLFAQ